ncbi:ATP-binding protein [Flavobacteriaceae bacterium]|nr:ATP-binding protein [Flavobacteriaceae bacterium]MDB4496101.1 ATP-binding protein [Flavobacteriaceae bacterium]
MNKSYPSLFNFILLFLFSLTIQAKNNVIHNKEVFHVKTSLIFIEEPKDSVLEKKYEELKTLFEISNYSESLQGFLRLNEKVSSSENSILKFKINSFIAKIYRKSRDHKKAISSYKKSLNLLNGFVLEDDGIVFTQQKYLAKTLLDIGTQFQLLEKYDSAFFYYKKLEDIVSYEDEILDNKALSYSNLSGIYQSDTTYTNHLEKAIDYANKAISIHKKRGNRINQAYAINNLANVYLLNKDFEQSKKIYFEGIKLIKRDTSTRAIRIKENLYFNMAWAMRNLKEYHAYDTLFTALDLSDDLRDIDIAEMLERVTGEYNVDVVRREGEFEKKKAQSLTLLIGISFFAIILLLAFFLNQYKLRQRNLSLQLSKQELAQQQKLEKVRTESQIRILNATLDGKETERKQIAETLHDSVSALLSSANLHLQACKKLFKGPIPVEVEKSQNIIHEASHKIRNLSHTLVSSVLLKFGLAYAIKDMAEKYSNSQLEIVFQTKNIQRYDQDFEIKLHNIIQELVNNAIKHSEATIAEINLVEKDKKLLLSINDNGKGFDTLEMSHKDGLGINQIDARIHMMSGKFIIDSQKGKGTKISIELPVYMKKSAMFS